MFAHFEWDRFISNLLKWAHSSFHDMQLLTVDVAVVWHQIAKYSVLNFTAGFASNSSVFRLSCLLKFGGQQ